MYSSKNKADTSSDLVKEVVDSKLVVIEQNFFFCREEPLAQGEAGSWDGWGIVLYIQFVWELVGSKLSHWRAEGERKRGGARKLDATLTHVRQIFKINHICMFKVGYLNIASAVRKRILMNFEMVK